MAHNHQKQQASFSAWRESVNFLLEAKYLIDVEDAGLSQAELTNFWQQGEQPEEFVDWFGQKYDLELSDSWLRGRLATSEPLQ